MAVLNEHRCNKYKPFSTDSLITQVIILNMLDALLTLYATRLGVGELNPIMDWLLQGGAWQFFAVKVSVVITFSLFINRFGGERSKRVFKYICAVFWALTVCHIFGILAIREGP